MSPFEIVIAIVSILMTILGTIGTMFLKNLITTLGDMSHDINGIKVEIGRICTTQTNHEEKFESNEKRFERIEEKIFK